MSAHSTSGDPWFCVNCANEYAPAVDPPAECLICTDEREFVPPGGQQWARPTDLDERTIDCSEVEPDLLAITLDPQVGIGQRTFLIRTPAGNLLWEPPGYIDQSLVRLIRSHGGISAIGTEFSICPTVVIGQAPRRYSSSHGAFAGKATPSSR